MEVGWKSEVGREGGREDNSELGWLLLGFLLGCVPLPLCGQEVWEEV